MQIKFHKHTFALFGAYQDPSDSCFIFRGSESFFPFLYARGRGVSSSPPPLASMLVPLVALFSHLQIYSGTQYLPLQYRFERSLANIHEVSTTLQHAHLIVVNKVVDALDASFPVQHFVRRLYAYPPRDSPK